MLQAQFRLNFQWPVAAEGYTWLTATPPGDEEEALLLSTGVPSGSPVRIRRYLPFEQTGMFRDFAATAPDQDSIKKFADRYGLLGGREMGTMIPLRDRPRGNGFLTGVGERLSHWSNEIKRLRRAVDLYDWTREGDIEALERFIVWKGDMVSYQSHPEWSPGQEIPADVPMTFDTIASRHIHDDRLERLERGDVIKPALFFIQNEINKRLGEETSVRLLWDQDEAQFTNCIVPSSLLGALWLQFSRSVESGSTFRQCQECGTWFELSPKAGRSDKLFCSTACRVKAFRRRQAEGDPDTLAGAAVAPAGRAAAPRSKTGKASGRRAKDAERRR